MSGCFDFACAHCGGKIRWVGTLDDNPPCPRCGEYLSADTIDQAKVLLEQIEAEATEEPAFPALVELSSEEADYECSGQAIGSDFREEMPWLQYPGGDYDHDTLDIEGE